jgi:hypothetical protein
MDAGTSSGKLQKSRTGLKIAVGIVGLLIVIGACRMVYPDTRSRSSPMQGALYPSPPRTIFLFLTGRS